jgi:uncharacterized protein YdhG (YjbR/CyaY superfamily)
LEIISEHFVFKCGDDRIFFFMTISKIQPQTIDEFISMFPLDVRNRLKKLRKIIKESAGQAEETISYGIPTFKLNGNLVHFAAYKNHIGFYPTSSGIEAFKKKLLPYKWAKGSVQFPLNKPIPFDLVKKIVVYRVKENLKKN